MKISSLLRCGAAAATLIFALTACSDDNCTVNGTVEDIEGLSGCKVLIGQTRAESDTVEVIDGKFTYTCPINPDAFENILFVCDNQGKDHRYRIQFVPDSKSIGISLGEECAVTGSPLSETWLRIRKESGRIGQQEGPDACTEYRKQAYLENCANVLGKEIFPLFARYLTLEEFDELLSKGTEELKNDPKIGEIRKDKVAEEATSAGCKFVDFSGKTPDGKDVSLSEYVGAGNTLTLVDFWASWCGPCMKSMPKLAEIRDRWHDKGLQVVGVAVWDKDNSASRIKVKEKGMVWPQIFVGEDRSCTDSYGIFGIPYTILIDSNGTIVERGVANLDKMEQIISEKLGK